MKNIKSFTGSTSFKIFSARSFKDLYVNTGASVGKLESKNASCSFSYYLVVCTKQSSGGHKFRAKLGAVQFIVTVTLSLRQSILLSLSMLCLCSVVSY